MTDGERRLYLDPDALARATAYCLRRGVELSALLNELLAALPEDDVSAESEAPRRALPHPPLDAPLRTQTQASRTRRRTRAHGTPGAPGAPAVVLSLEAYRLARAASGAPTPDGSGAALG